MTSGTTTSFDSSTVTSSNSSSAFHVFEEPFGEDTFNTFRFEQERCHLDRYDPAFYLANFHEYEQGMSEPIVRGRLKASINFWSAIGAEPDILSIIDDG